MEGALFRVASRQEREGVVVALAGELDMAGATRLTEALAEAKAAGGPLTVDLTGLDFIDSSGLGVLVRFNNEATAAGFPYRVIAGPPRVHRAFVLSGLDRALPFAA
jgi:anti-sigma B factor antagonist